MPIKYFFSAVILISCSTSWAQQGSGLIALECPGQTRLQFQTLNEFRSKGFVIRNESAETFDSAYEHLKSRFAAVSSKSTELFFMGTANDLFRGVARIPEGYEIDPSSVGSPAQVNGCKALVFAIRSGTSKKFAADPVVFNRLAPMDFVIAGLMLRGFHDDMFRAALDPMFSTISDFEKYKVIKNFFPTFIYRGFEFNTHSVFFEEQKFLVGYTSQARNELVRLYADGTPFAISSGRRDYPLRAASSGPLYAEKASADTLECKLVIYRMDGTMAVCDQSFVRNGRVGDQGQVVFSDSVYRSDDMQHSRLIVAGRPTGAKGESIVFRGVQPKSIKAISTESECAGFSSLRKPGLYGEETEVTVPSSCITEVILEWPARETEKPKQKKK